MYIATTPITNIIITMNTRRTFLRSLAATAGSSAMLGSRVLAQAPPPPVKLEEADPVATALGFKLDTQKVDAQKYPQHTKEQKCSGCAFYQEKPGEALSPCTVFNSKLVPPGAWCMSFVKKSTQPK